MPNFHNPLGSCMPDAKKERMVGLLAERGIPLIEDDVYGDLGFAGKRPKVAKAFDREGLVLVCSSFCKTLAPGYRVGWIVPGRYQAQIQHLKYVSSIGMATLPQLAVADFLAHGGFDRHLRRLRRVYAGQIERVTHAISRYFPEGTRVTRPAGGYVLWVELPGDVDAVELFDRALAEKISLAPGPIFAPKGGFRNFIRLSCGSEWSEAVDQGLLKLGQLIARMG
jgi:DNA-binding transcriptional MocR family regulator